MLALCAVCLVVGSTARELTHWALGDKVFGPYAAHVAQVGPRFRCGDGSLFPPSERTGSDRIGLATTDEARTLPRPSR